VSILHSRRTALIGGIGAGLLVPRRADANTVFTSFGFKATGTTTDRTMPDRLAEIHNVLDYGADPGGGNPSVTTPAIQAAVDAVVGAGRGRIHFPLGSYQTNAPITFNYDGDLSINFTGDIGSVIFGNFNGYIFDRNIAPVTVTISIASPGVISETSHGRLADGQVRFATTGALPTGLVAGVIYYVKTVLSSSTYTVSATAGGTAIVTTGSQSGTQTRLPNNTSGGRIFERLIIQNGHASGGGVRIGATTGAAFRDCLISAFICVTTEDAVGVSSQNVFFQDCTMSNGGAVSGSHFIIIGGGGSIEGCTLSGADTAVRAYGSGLSITGCRSERCNTSYLFGVDSGDNPVGCSGFSIMSCSTEGCWTSYHLAGPCNGFAIVGVGALGHDAGNSGVVPGIMGSQYGLRIDADCASNGVIQSCTFGGDFQAIAGLSFAGATSRGNVVVRETNAISNNGGGVGWIFPSNAYTAQFFNNNESPLWTFSQLPSGGNVLEGDEYDLTDANSTTWGANVTAGSSSGRVRVRYNGTNWTVMGK